MLRVGLALILSKYFVSWGAFKFKNTHRMGLYKCQIIYLCLVYFSILKYALQRYVDPNSDIILVQDCNEEFYIIYW